MSTTLPELPKAAAYATQIKEGRVLFEPRASFNVRGHVSLFSADQMHAYGLAVWKAAIQHAVEVCAEHADKHRGCGSGTYSQGRLYAAEDIAHALASLPLPEQGGPQ